MKRKDLARRGFTLIELLLVLVILSVLGAVVVPKFTNKSKQAKETAAKTDISNIEVALDSFEIDTGRFPTDTEGLKALLEEPINTREDWKGPYLKRAPMDPWGKEYLYRYPGQYNEYGYDLSSAGADGISGNEDDIQNWTDDRYGDNN